MDLLKAPGELTGDALPIRTTDVLSSPMAPTNSQQIPEMDLMEAQTDLHRRTKQMVLAILLIPDLTRALQDLRAVSITKEGTS